jgi:hypothetical protein
MKVKRAPTRFKVTDDAGKAYMWSFQYLAGVYSTLGRRMNGWLLVTHDGCERFSEGNWIGFVPFVRLVAGNYGMETDIS